LDNLVEWSALWVTFAVMIQLISRVPALSSGNVLKLFHGVGSLTLAPLVLVVIFISKRGYLVLITIAFCLVSTSTKIYVGLLIGFCVYAVIMRSTRVDTFIIFSVLISLFIFLTLGFDKSTEYIFVGKSDEMIHTGSGRTYIYEGYAEKIARSPLLGYGFSIGERHEVGESGGVLIAVSHNSLLAAFLTAGIIGLSLIFLFFYDLMFLNVFNLQKGKYCVGLLSASLACLVSSMLGPGVGTRVNGAWVSTALLAALVSTAYSKKINLIRR